ncbi:MAG: hypothetical protein JWQ04_1750 [Pedosphaera sp.]|nr:hypothetical protein [Pedosphaera sp.]
MNTQTKNEYLLLFRGDESYKGLSAEQLRSVISQTKAWFERLETQGKFKDGRPLGREGSLVSGKNGRTVADGPFAESKEAIGGFLLVQADGIEEAIAIAKGNPMLAYGATIEVRPIAEECPLDACARKLAQEEQLAHA